MTIFQSIVLGIVQGIGEFLPISSSAHLIIVPWIMGWDDGGLTFDIALHAGTLIALLIYFRSEWIALAKAALSIRPAQISSPRLLMQTEDLRMLVFIIVATIPGAIFGLLLEKKAETAFRSPKLISITMAVMGIILWIVDKKGGKKKSLTQFTLKDTFLIGLSQAFALVPGVSRSGVTISTALAQGYERDAAARFSFFLSMPIIAGACILKLRHLTAHDLTLPFILGVLAAAISGYLAIGGLIQFLKTKSYGAFAVYRILFAVAIWVALFIKG